MSKHAVLAMSIRSNSIQRILYWYSVQWAQRAKGDKATQRSVTTEETRVLVLGKQKRNLYMRVQEYSYECHMGSVHVKMRWLQLGWDLRKGSDDRMTVKVIAENPEQLPCCWCWKHHLGGCTVEMGLVFWYWHQERVCAIQFWSWLWVCSPFMSSAVGWVILRKAEVGIS